LVSPFSVNRLTWILTKQEAHINTRCFDTHLNGETLKHGHHPSMLWQMAQGHEHWHTCENNSTDPFSSRDPKTQQICHQTYTPLQRKRKKLTNPSSEMSISW
jgi:hypothetical protein